MADPYYNLDPYFQRAAQAKALGNTSGTTPTDLTSAIQANYADQASTTRANEAAYMQQEQINNQTAMTNQQIQQSKQMVSASKQSALRQDVSGGMQIGNAAYKVGQAAYDKYTSPGTGTTTGTTSAGPTTAGYLDTGGTTLNAGSYGAGVGTASYGTTALTTPELGSSAVGPGVGQTGYLTTEGTTLTAGEYGASAVGEGAGAEVANTGMGFTFNPAQEGVGSAIEGVGAAAEATEGAADWGWVGDIFGAIVSGVGGVLSPEMLCTELHRQGLLDSEIFKYEILYTKDHVTWEECVGYWTLAIPLIPIMQRSKIFTSILAPFIRGFAYEMAHRANPEIKSSQLGKFVIWAGLPLCRLICSFKNKNWRLSCRVS